MASDLSLNKDNNSKIYINEYTEKNMNYIDYTLVEIKSKVKSIYSKTQKDAKDSITGNQNCLLCTLAVECYFRGINILPRAVYSPRDPIFTKSGCKDVVKGGKKIKINSYNDIKNNVINSKNGSRFYMHVQWNGGNGGHEFIIINYNGKAMLIDAQNNIVSEIGSNNVKEYTSDIIYSKSSMTRIDIGKINNNLIDLNNLKYQIKFDEKIDIPYMKKHGMISKDDLNDNITETYILDNIFKNAKINAYRSNRVITERSFIKMHDSLYTLLNEFNDSGISEIPLTINYSEDILPETEKSYIKQRVSKLARIIASPEKEINVTFISAPDFYDKFKNKYIFGTYNSDDNVVYMIYPEEVPEQINYENLCIHEFSHAVLYAVNPNLNENNADGIVITWANGHLDDLKNLASVTGDDKYYIDYVDSINFVKDQISRHGESILFDIVRENITESTSSDDDEEPEKNDIKMIEMDKPKESGFKKIQNKALDANVKFKKKLAKGKKKSQDAKNAGKAVAKIPLSVKGMISDTVNKWDEADDDRRKEYMLKPGFRKKYWKALKLAIVHYGAFSINPILNIVLLICHKLSNSKDARIRNEMIRELKAEIKVTDEKIEDAKFDRDKSAKYKLMRIREKLVAELDRVTANSKFI